MRSIWKGSFFNNTANTINRSSTIINTLFKKKVLSHDGRNKKSLTISRYMLGMKIGQFIFNRKMGLIHKKRKRSNKKAPKSSKNQVKTTKSKKK